MVYKFIRIDLSEPCKVILPVGKHIIGRGKFLVDNADDNKVSRNHAELEVAADSVTVKSLHINPCFFIKKSTDETQVLSENNTINLSNGDKFGILPQTYWYELIYCHDENENKEDKENMKHVENRMEDLSEINTQDEQVETCSDTITIKKENVSINFDLDEADDNVDSQESISLQRNESSTQNYNFDLPLTDTLPDKDDNTGTSVKRPHNSQESGQNDESKKARTESEVSDSIKAGPSNAQMVSPKKEVKDEPSQSPAQPPTVQLRERCMYGANCYRKNIQHKAQFSHPQDSDWDDERRQCQFGASCKRRDPRHWRDYLHPPGVNPPNPNRPGKRKQKRDIVSDSEDSSPSKLIVTGKRVRKTVKREGWTDSEPESEPDPYGTDESEEWVPPSDATQTQDYSQEWD